MATASATCRASGPGCRTSAPRRRRALAEPVLSVAAGRRAATTSPTTATSIRVRHARRLRRARRRRPRARACASIVDLVPNHTSDRARLVPGGAGGAARAAATGPLPLPRRVAAGRRRAAERLGQRSSAVRRGPASPSRRQPGQWYLHLFAPEQPDLDWTNAEVRAEFESILRFWFDRGVDGFRIDVAHGLAKDPEMPDLAGNFAVGAASEGHPHWDRDEVHDIYRAWRRSPTPTPATGPSSARCGCRTRSGSRRYLRPDELHTAFNFSFLLAPWDADGCGRRSTRPSTRSPRSGRLRPGCCPTMTSFAT